MRSVGIFFLCTICVCLSACSGGWNPDDLGDDDDVSDFQSGFPMDNVKILRRSYGDNKATILATGEKYYDEFARNLLATLNKFYGNFNNQANDNIFTFLRKDNEGKDISYENEFISSGDYIILEEDLNNNEDYFKYFYDAMRYQITEVEPYYMPRWVKTDDEGVKTYSNSTEQQPPEGYVANDDAFKESNLPAGIEKDGCTIPYYEIKVDTSKGWIWGMSTKLTDETNAFITEYLKKNITSKGYSENNGVFTGYVYREDFQYKAKIDEATIGFYSYYVGNRYYRDEYGIQTFDNTLYTDLYLCDKEEEDLTDDEMSKFPQYALTYAIYSIINKKTPNEITVTKTDNGNIYSVVGFDSVKDALESERQYYMDNASYVGLTQRDKEKEDQEKSDQEKIAQYILDYVIGSDAVSFSKSSNSKQNLYYEELVPIVVEYCTRLTQIGGAVYTATDPEVIAGEKNVGDPKDDPTYLSGQYLSSDIVDYEYNSSYVNGDCYDDDDTDRSPFAEFAHLGQYEYQSMLFMPTKSGRIDELWLDFAYYGDGGTNDTITIRTYVRNYIGGGQFDIYKKDITVTEGTLDVGEDGTTLCFDFSKLADDKYLKIDKIDFDKAINSAYYQARLSGIFRPSTGLSKEITISGSTEARNYYTLVQGEFRDYGVFNYKMLEGTEYYDCCYVEVAFEVISATTNNYKFYCGCSQLNEYIEPDYSKYQ